MQFLSLADWTRIWTVVILESYFAWEGGTGRARLCEGLSDGFCIWKFTYINLTDFMSEKRKTNT